MPINDLSFNTGGSWDSTFVLYNGQNWDAARRFFVELRTFGENNNDGGIDEGGFAPDDVFIIDICESQKSLFCLEVNPVSCAGLYKIDPEIFVSTITQAIQDRVLTASV